MMQLNYFQKKDNVSLSKKLKEILFINLKNVLFMKLDKKYI